MLRWLRKDTDCAWTAATCSSAAGKGHFALLKWLREEGCPWDEQTCAAAASGGFVHILEWLREGGCPWDEQTCAAAAENRHLEALVWARDHGCPWSERTAARAAAGGDLSVLEYLAARGCPLGQAAVCNAAEEGHVHVLEWLRARGSPMPRFACTCAAWGRSLEALKVPTYLRVPTPAPTSTHLCLPACLNICTLQFLRANGCEWDEDTCFAVRPNADNNNCSRNRKIEHKPSSPSFRNPPHLPSTPLLL